MTTSTALVTITVTPTVNAVNDSYSTAAGTPVNCPVLTNDMVNGLPATPAALNQAPEVTVPPAHGTVEWDGTQFVYTPEEGFCGADTFEYEIERTCTFEFRFIAAASNEGPPSVGFAAGSYVSTGWGTALGPLPSSGSTRVITAPGIFILDLRPAQPALSLCCGAGFYAGEFMLSHADGTPVVARRGIAVQPTCNSSTFATPLTQMIPGEEYVLTIYPHSTCVPV